MPTVDSKQKKTNYELITKRKYSQQFIFFKSWRYEEKYFVLSIFREPSSCQLVLGNSQRRKWVI